MRFLRSSPLSWLSYMTMKTEATKGHSCLKISENIEILVFRLGSYFFPSLEFGFRPKSNSMSLVNYSWKWIFNQRNFLVKKIRFFFLVWNIWSPFVPNLKRVEDTFRDEWAYFCSQYSSTYQNLEPNFQLSRRQNSSKNTRKCSQFPIFCYIIALDNW